MNQTSKYVLATGAAATPRLRLLNDIFGPASRELLIKAGLRGGQRVAEIGCGTGLMALWMADEVGNGGSVIAVDVSGEQLQIARQTAVPAELKNISFHTADAYNTHLSHGEFDLVYSRFLFCHLTRPPEALAEMKRLLKTGGVLVAEDFEMSSVRTYPATPAYTRLVEISRGVDSRLGVNSDVGANLHSLFQDGGFLRPEIVVHEAAFLRGERKRFWEMTLREAGHGIVECGAATEDELRSVLTEMDEIARDEATLVLVARVFQLWASKP